MKTVARRNDLFLGRSEGARRREAARRLEAQEPVEMDPHLAAEAERVHQAVVAASSEGEDAARPLPSLPPLR